MEQIVSNYIRRMRDKHEVSAVMVAGSYVTGRMGPNSDIDIFFLWPREYEAMRGRERFEGIEFEYFLSPEWKYYDRMRTDPVSVRLYSRGKALWDPDGRMARIIATAQEKATESPSPLSDDSKRDLAFWLETIRRDGEDLFRVGALDNFAYLTSVSLAQMTRVLCGIRESMPVYGKYGADEVGAVDPEYADLLRDFLRLAPNDPERLNLWVGLCRYLEAGLGSVDVEEYSSIQRL